MNWTTTQGESTDSVLAELLDELTSKFNAGEPIDPADYERRLPEHADQIRKLIGALEAMGQLGRLPPVVDKAGGGVGYEQDRGRLGDFRIVREIGRGGMGVVYEAEQISLGRRVALKVLPFAAMLDDRQLERFKNEARAAASLKHPNIVGIHSVGCERAVHFYAMEYVEGQTLAEIIDRLRVSPTAERLRTQDARPHHGDGEPASHGVGTSIEPSDHGRRETSQPAPDVPHGDPLAETRPDRPSRHLDGPVEPQSGLFPLRWEVGHPSGGGLGACSSVRRRAQGHQAVQPDPRPARQPVDQRFWVGPNAGRIKHHDDRRRAGHAPLHESGTGPGQTPHSGPSHGHLFPGCHVV